MWWVLFLIVVAIPLIASSTWSTVEWVFYTVSALALFIALIIGEAGLPRWRRRR